MKVCSKCGVEKSQDCFSKREEGYYRSDCKDCRSKYRKEYHYKNKDIENTKNKNRKEKLYSRLKNKPCIDCKRRYPRQAMEFDHLPETNKRESISALIRDRGDVLEILEEIEKCDLVCANCHRIRTYKRQPVHDIKHKSYFENLNAFKDKPCIDCKQKFPQYVMCLIYKNPNEKINSKIRYKNVKLLLMELPKCEVICINCYRIRTYCKNLNQVNIIDIE